MVVSAKLHAWFGFLSALEKAHCSDSLVDLKFLVKGIFFFLESGSFLSFKNMKPIKLDYHPKRIELNFFLN
jgi:hypothetical protein